MRAARSLTSPDTVRQKNDRLSQSQISFLKTFDWFFGRVYGHCRENMLFCMRMYRKCLRLNYLEKNLHEIGLLN